MSIVCTGSIAFDYLMTFPGYFRDHIIPEHLEKISLSFLVDSMIRQKGGTAPNIAYTLALLGEHPKVMGTVGVDFEEYREWLEQRCVDTSLIRVISGEYTASFFANTDLANSQIASFYTGAMSHASELSIRYLDNEKPDLVIISPNDPKAMVKYARECAELKIPYLYDPSQQIVRMDPRDLRKGVESAQSLFINDYEFELVQKHTKMTLNDLLGYLDFMVVTRGENGASIYTKDDEVKIRAVKPDKIADPTGVGDAFRGGFVRGFKLGLDWETCGQMGALAATYCLERRGTLNHAYSREEFVNRYQKCFGNTDSVKKILD